MVAKLCKDNGTTVLRVYESRDSYYTSPVFSFIKSASVTYQKEREMNSLEEANENVHDVLFASLKHACEYFEGDYMKQVETIYKTIA